jgi:GNAT superfamily N-acetyltransferase
VTSAHAPPRRERPQIHLATGLDIDEIGRIHALSRRTSYAQLVPSHALAQLTPAAQAEYWHRRLATEPHPHVAYVLRVRRTVEGFAMGSATGSTATLNAIHVMPGFHGTGLGQLLYDRLMDDFDSWACTTAILWVLCGNDRAQSFYRRNGWVADGSRRTHTIGGVEVPIVRYRRPLSPRATGRNQ